MGAKQMHRIHIQ